MVLKIISATEAKAGTSILIEGEPYVIKKIDISKTGKHGASKCRIEASNIATGQKKIIVVPGHERFEVPMIDKRKGQILSISNKLSVMDMENFETFEIDCPDELKPSLKEGLNIEYWDVEGRKIIKKGF